MRRSSPERCFADIYNVYPTSNQDNVPVAGGPAFLMNMLPSSATSSMAGADKVVSALDPITR